MTKYMLIKYNDRVLVVLKLCKWVFIWMIWCCYWCSCFCSNYLGKFWVCCFVVLSAALYLVLRYFMCKACAALGILLYGLPFYWAFIICVSFLFSCVCYYCKSACKCVREMLYEFRGFMLTWALDYAETASRNWEL